MPRARKVVTGFKRVTGKNARNLFPRFPGGPTRWVIDRVLYMSIPFTYNLPAVREELYQTSIEYDRAVVGGPAVDIMPEYLQGIPHVEIGKSYPGVLQIINPMATRTSTGCIRRCSFCGIGSGLIEPGGFKELDDWPDKPILTDNNLLSCSREHFDKVIDRLVVHGKADFNQGLDARLMTEYHAKRIAEIKKVVVRVSCDSHAVLPKWKQAVDLLLDAGVDRGYIRSFALIGFDNGPEEAIDRMNAMLGHGKTYGVFPMWFHNLRSLVHDEITEEQRALGWTERNRTYVRHLGMRKMNMYNSARGRGEHTLFE